MSTNPMISFDFDNQLVRTVEKGGDIWFVAADLAKVLGYALATNFTRMVDDDEKGIHIVNTLERK